MLTIFDQVISDSFDEMMTKDDHPDIWESEINDCFSEIQTNHDVNYVIGIIAGSLETKESRTKQLYMVKEKGESYILARKNTDFINPFTKQSCLNVIYNLEPCVFIFFCRPSVHEKLSNTLDGFYFGDNKGRVFKTDWHLDNNNRISKTEKWTQIVL
jgi:hypothetical protein